MPPDRGVDRTAGTFEGPNNEREIDFRYLTLGELSRELLMRPVIFRDDETTARLLVETMNNAGTLFSADPGEAGAMMKQGVDQSMRLVSGARMHDQPRRFVEHEQVVVFEENLERNLLGLRVNFTKRRNGQPNDIAGAHRLASAD